MYYVGICDDDQIFIEYIKRLICAGNEKVEFYEYLSGEELIEDMQKQERYDLLILDVCLPDMDGNETAAKFRQEFPDTVLVFCSGVYMPTTESFETTPYRYWLKEYTEERMKKEVECVLARMKQNRIIPSVLGKREKQIVKLSADRISHIAIARKGSVIYCENNKEKYSSPKKVAELYEQLKDFGFAYAHNSYIVNLKHVAVAGQKELELMNGEKLTISRARSKEFLKRFAIELSGKYDEDR